MLGHVWKHKPPKHLLLRFAVKTLTDNTEVIRLINKFGHGVLYSQLEESDTTLCLQKLAYSLNQKVCTTSSNLAICLHESCMGQY